MEPSVMPESPLLALSPRQALNRYQRAMLDKSADDLADLYAADAVHEFPFAFPSAPQRLVGREAIRATYRSLWGALAARVQSIQEVAVHETADPEVLIAEQVVVVSREGESEGETMAVPGLLVIRVRDGEIVHVRDYIDTGAAGRARG
jgi:uncharacterized protein